MSTTSEAFVKLPGEIVGAEDEREQGRKKDKEKKKKDKEKEAQYGRAVETLFRSAYSTHLGLTSMADGKANIMITINGLVMSVLLASVSPRIDNQEWLLAPTVVLLLSCLGSLICAVLAVRPRIRPTEITLESVRAERSNILFFGNYCSLDEFDFRQAMRELRHDPEAMYDVMTRDLYGMGMVMSRKFRLLRYSYTLFMWGLVVGVLLYIGFYLTQVY
jgi:hypothetical protein